MIYGVDVSAYQPINFALTTPGDGHPVDFAFIKITEGLGYTNPRWTGQRQWARDHGLPVGFYHYPHMANDPVTEADNFLGKIAWQPGDIIVLDWEGYDPANQGVPHSRQLFYRDAWLAYVKGKMPRHRVGMYCNTDYWLNIDNSGNCGDFLWIATGGRSAGSPGIPFPWTFHQYSTAGNYDHDVAQFATRDDMIAWAEGNEDMPLTDAEINKIATKVLTLDGVIEAPTDAPDRATNPYWTLESYVKDTGARVRAATTALAAIAAQAKTNGSGISSAGQKLDAIKTVLDSLDLSHVPDEVAAKIEALKLIVTVQEGA